MSKATRTKKENDAFEIAYAKMMKTKGNPRGTMKGNSPKYLREKARISERKRALALNPNHDADRVTKDWGKK